MYNFIFLKTFKGFVKLLSGSNIPYNNPTIIRVMKGNRVFRWQDFSATKIQISRAIITFKRNHYRLFNFERDLKSWCMWQKGSFSSEFDLRDFNSKGLNCLDKRAGSYKVYFCKEKVPNKTLNFNPPKIAFHWNL